MKTGKTTTATRFPKSLLLATEVGYKALPGVNVQPINKWSDIKAVLKQLKDPKVKERFSNIIIDTADIAYDLCEKYVCSNYKYTKGGEEIIGVDNVGDIPFGAGYSMVAHEFDEALRTIPQLGYGLIMISHSQDSTFKDENGNEFMQITPTLGKRPRNIVDRMSDIIGFANPTLDENGRSYTRLYMRGTPRFVAGSRFKYTPDYIEFNYQNLVDAIADAIQKQADEFDGKYVTDERDNSYLVEEVDFDELMQKFNDLVSAGLKLAGDNFGELLAPKIKSITDKYLGRGNLVKDMSREQTEALTLIVNDLEELIGQGI